MNFVNDDEVDGLAAAYHASSELQNATVNGVNYRCEVGYKHQPQQQQSQQSSVTSAPQHHHQQQPQQQQMFARSDSDSMSGYSAGNLSTSMSAASRTGAGFLPSLSPKQALQQHSSSSLASGGSHSPMQQSHSHSFVPTGPSSPLPGYYQVTMPNISSGASVHSVGSNSTGGVFSQGSPYPSSVHSPVPVSAIVSYMPASSGGSVHSGQMYPQVQGSGYPIVGVPANQHYFPAQPAHHQQQQTYMQHQPQYYAAPQQQQQHQQGYYGNGAPYQHAPMAGPYYGAAQQPEQYGYYAPQQQQSMQQQGYYAPSGQSVPMVPPPSNMGHRAHPPQAGTYEAAPAGPQLTEQMLSQHKQGSRTRRPSMGPQPTGPYYNAHPQVFAQTYQAQHPYGPEGGVAPEGRRSQRNISNKSNISEITSATLNELQDDDEDEEVHDEEVQSPLPTIDENAAVVQSAAEDAATSEIAQNMSCHLKSTLQTLAPSAPVINCKLSTRRNQRNSTGGSNTTEITAQVLYDLQMQEQRLEKEEEEEGCTEPPNQRCNTPVESALRTSVTQNVASEVHLEKDCNTKTAPNSAVKQVSSTPEPAAIASRAKSISPFTLSAATLAQLQSDCEIADSANNRDKLFQRRSKRNLSDRSNASDITAALAFMQIDASNPDYFRSLDDDGESYHSSAEASAVCVCGKALRSTASPSGGPVATCPFGTTACSCVYSATC